MGDKQATVENIILTVLALVIIAICIGCIYAFVRAIFLFIFSQGKEDKIKAAWNSIRYMIIGIILTIILLFVFPLIFKWMNVKGYENYSAKNIFNKAGTLIKGASNIGDVIKESQKDMQYRGQLYYDTDSESPLPEDYSDYSL
ncbi:hypothetical protein K9M48_04020 [Candidatus Gracilibacteria bacterium]|nr:hypothetical protein [Candidatus Gracilibacteria bacterium]